MKQFLSISRVFLRVNRSSLPLQSSVKMSNQPGGRSSNYVQDPRSLSNVVKKLENFAPLNLAESWDNVGVLVEPPSEVSIKRILLTNDLTESVLEEAVQHDVQLIISYHPLIFPALKSIKYTNWKERIIGTLLERRIALYSPHTAWDCVEGGVNDWLAAAFGSDGLVEPLKRYDSGQKEKVLNAIFSSQELADIALRDINAGVSCFHQCIPQSDGQVWLRIHTKNEMKLMPYLSAAAEVTISTLQTVSQGTAGQGRQVTLKSPISLKSAISCIKQHLALPDVSIAVAHGKNYESNISSVAICAGSGASVLKGVKADLYLTGEMSHHDILDAVHKGVHVILTRHSNSERGFLHVAAKSCLKNLLPEVEFIISSKDKDPLVTV